MVVPISIKLFFGIIGLILFAAVVGMTKDMFNPVTPLGDRILDFLGVPVSSAL